MDTTAELEKIKTRVSLVVTATQMMRRLAEIELRGELRPGEYDAIRGARERLYAATEQRITNPNSGLAEYVPARIKEAISDVRKIAKHWGYTLE